MQQRASKNVFTCPPPPEIVFYYQSDVLNIISEPEPVNSRHSRLVEDAWKQFQEQVLSFWDAVSFILICEIIRWHDLTQNSIGMKKKKNIFEKKLYSLTRNLYLSLSLTHTHTHTHTHTLSLSLSPPLSLVEKNDDTLSFAISLSLSHTHTLSLSLSLSLKVMAVILRTVPKNCYKIVWELNWNQNRS